MSPQQSHVLTALRPLLVLVASVAVTVAGCASPSMGITAASSVVNLPRTTVVAIIDSGTNPYHEVFQSGAVFAPNDARLAALGSAEIVTLSTGSSFDQLTSKDSREIDRLDSHHLYAFEGTRLMSISFLPADVKPKIFDQNGHGSATSSIAARYAPDVIIVLVQVDGSICRNATCFNNPMFAQGLQWAAEQPWIDVISLSANFPANTPDSSRVHPEMAAFLKASQLASKNGKLVLNSAGNYAVPTLTDYFNGFPSTIAVGAVEGSSRGETPVSSKGVDVVANNTELGALPDNTTGTTWMQGTSISTPIVAGVLGESIYQLRAVLHDNHAPDGVLVRGTDAKGKGLEIRNVDVRNALNLTARQFGPTDYAPLSGPSNDSLRNLVSITLPIALAPTQMGWGYVSGENVDRISKCLLTQDCASPHQEAFTKAYQSRWQSLRETYWSLARDA